MNPENTQTANSSTSSTIHASLGYLSGDQQRHANPDAGAQQKGNPHEKSKIEKLPLVTDEGELKCLLYKECGVTLFSQALVSLWRSGRVAVCKKTDGRLWFAANENRCGVGQHEADEPSVYERNMEVLLLGIMDYCRSIGRVRDGYELTEAGRSALDELLRADFNPTDDELLWTAHELAEQEQTITDDEFRELFRAWRNRGALKIDGGNL
jgi:hypothetical protein